jgi:methylamine--corrinoid protein Co-methyltransferase
MQPAFGVLPNDGLGIAAISELKVDYERLKKVVFCRHSGHHTYGLYGPLLGGFAGGVETTAIIHVAHHFLGLLMYDAQWHCGFPLHLHYGCNSSRDLLWLIAVTSQALSRNTHSPISVSPFSAAGPCTDMVVHEMCAISIAASVSGANLLACAPARNRHPERGTGMEARICAEAGHLVARQRLTRTEANRVVKSVLGLYEDKLDDAPLGLSLSECYDLDRLQPTREYVELYERIKEQMGNLGMDYSLL